MGARWATLCIACGACSWIRAQGIETSFIPFDLSTGRPIVQVTINGDGPFHFVFDTASTQTFVSDDVAQRLRLPRTGTTTIRTPGTSSVLEAPKASIKELRIGDFKFFDRPVVVLPNASLFRAIRADGVISLADFDGYVVSVDYFTKRLTIRTGVLDQEGSVPLLIHDGVPGIEAEVKGQKVFCVLDTGSPFLVSLPSSFATGGGRRTGTVRSVTDRIPFMETVLDGKIKAGSMVLNNPIVQILRGLPYGNLGSRFFALAVVSFDVKSSLARIEPRAQK